MPAAYSHLSPFLSDRDADEMSRIAERLGSFGTYANEATSDSLGEELPQRFDAALNYIEAGIDGQGNADDRETAARRTNYFRETYVYGEEIRVDGIQAFADNPEIVSAAKNLSGLDVIVPAIIYANILIPGQELAVHTDVPEFRGVNRKNVPQWLLVTMLQSGLFDAWRVPIITCVSWFGSAKGGAFTFYPDGVDGARDSIPAKHNSAILLDTDTVLHGVERVAAKPQELPPISAATRLHYLKDGQWLLRDGETDLTNYDWSELRYSISWKAYCFADDGERKAFENGHDVLDLESILNRLEKELRHRGALTGARPEPTAFALLLVQTFVRFP